MLHKCNNVCFFKNNFTSLFLALLDLHHCADFSLVVRRGSSVAMLGFLTAGASLARARGRGLV